MKPVTLFGGMELATELPSPDLPLGIPVTYKASTVDEPAHNLAVLMKGRVEILTTKRTPFVPIHIVMPGEAFALSSMITGRFVSAARAAEDSEVCALPVDNLTQIIEQDYKGAYFFMKQIAILYQAVCCGYTTS